MEQAVSLTFQQHVSLAQLEEHLPTEQNAMVRVHREMSAIANRSISKLKIKKIITLKACLHKSEKGKAKSYLQIPFSPDRCGDIPDAFSLRVRPWFGLLLKTLFFTPQGIGEMYAELQ